MLTTIYSVLGASEATLGVESDWAERVERREHDPSQLAQVYAVRKLAALSAGDWEAAEHALAAPNALRAADGSHCTPVLLSSVCDGQLCIAGVALLSSISRGRRSQASHPRSPTTSSEAAKPNPPCSGHP